MKIFFPIGAFYPSQIGGPGNAVYWHTCALKARGVEVSVTTSSLGLDKDSVTFNQELKRKCGVVFYGSSPTVSVPILKQIVKEIKDSDIIHLNGLFNILSIISFFYIKLFYSKKKIIWSVRGELSPNALVFGKFKKKVLLFFYKKWSKNIIFHSTSEKETAEIKFVFGGVKVVEIPNFIQPSNRIFLTPKKQFLYLGRIHRIKAIHKMIEGFAMSEKFRDSDFKLAIVGKHEERHEDYYEEIQNLIIEKRLQNKVEFLGHLIGDDKEKIYAESYALILPSETENFGNVVIESLNQGTPVIASKGTPWSVLENYQCGFHIDNNPNEIAIALDNFIDMSGEKYLNMRENSYKLVDEKFNITTQIHQWIEIYENVLNK